MSEKVTKKPETEETTAAAKKPAAKKAEKTEKKDNFLKRGGRKVKNWMSEHPFLSSAISAGVGAGITVGAGYGGKKLIEKRREQRNAYIPAEENSIDPNL